MSAFDVCAASPNDWVIGDPRSWTLESSADGTNWITVHEMAENDAQGTSNHGCWRSGGTFKDQKNTPPKEYFKLRNYITKGVASGRETFAAELGKDAKLDVSAVDDAVALNDLTLAADGGMTLTGAKIAKVGTLSVTGLASGMRASRIEIPCRLVACRDVASFDGWQVKTGGAVVNYSVTYDQAGGKITLDRKGMMLMVK